MTRFVSRADLDGTWHDLVRAYIPDADADTCSFILWELTCFPFGTVRQVERQVRQVSRKEGRMSYGPKTLDEAKTYRYTKWAGNPRGLRHDPRYCAAEVPEGGRSVLSRQCANRPKASGFCGKHGGNVNTKADD